MNAWRLFSPNAEALPTDLDNAIYNAVLKLEAMRHEQAIDWGEESQWAVDLQRNRFELQFEDYETDASWTIVGEL